MSICNACNVMLPDGETLKLHYKSEYHTFNLGRRAADLAPVRYKDYVALQAAQAEADAAAEAAAAPCLFICDACSKKFTSEGQFEAHMKSKKHVTRVKEILAAQRAANSSAATPSAATADGDDVDATGNEEGSSGSEGDEELVVDHRHCLFCYHESADLETNFDHMRSVHSFSVPDKEFLSDGEGLVIYLHNKVIDGKCIYCRGPKEFESPIAAQQHMTAKAHCALRYEEDDELEEFSQFYEYPPGDDDGDGGDDAGSEAMALREPVSGAPGSDLDLGGGRVARHRALMRYYKQRFRLDDARESVQIGRAAAHNRVLLAAGMAPLADGASGSSSGSGSRQVAIARAVALSTGTRGNRVDRSGQMAEASYWKHLLLRTGIAMNDIRRKHFVLPTAHLQ